MKTEHRWIGWGYDSTVCEHCHIDVYDPVTVFARQQDLDGAKFCEDVPAARAAFEESKRERPVRLKEALDAARMVLTPQQWTLLELHRFAPYRDRDIIRV